MVESKIRRQIMDFYGLTNYCDYEIIEVEPDNLKLKNIKTQKILNLRY